MRIAFVDKLLGTLSQASRRDLLLRRVRRALALQRRGEVRTDGLKLKELITAMQVEWIARDIHPWDRSISCEMKERLHTQQCLDDTQAAIDRLFYAIPTLNKLRIRVFGESPRALLIAGVIKRNQLKLVQHLPVGMKLKTLGVQFRIANWKLEPLSALDRDTDGSESYSGRFDVDGATDPGRTGIHADR